jgi:hypothetical protein
MIYFFGVITKNQVDSIIDYSLLNPETDITFIPSRRQIEYDGGYVNNWTTKTFSEYVKTKNKNIRIERDHSGPGQGSNNDDGFLSLKEDCKYFDLIHIDPWKKYYDLNEGIQWTVDMITFCYHLNPNIEYEIGTEEAIRSFSLEEVEEIIIQLKKKLPNDIYKKIKYCVVQCGNSLCNGKNSGIFDKDKLSKMINLVKKYNFISKEHNGDWVSMEVIKEKELLGLESINIAPEFGMIESKIILDKIKNHNEHYDKIYKLCFESGKWKKWINDDFDFDKQKDDLILITCHYIFSYPEFKEIKQNYLNIDEEIQNKMNNKLLELYCIFQERKKCIFCNTTNFETLLNKDYKSSLSLGLYNNICKSYFMPYNILICNQCNTAQNKYLGNLSIIYSNNHVDNFGEVKNRKHTLFSEFITLNKDIQNIIEVGCCHNILASLILEKNDTINYTIVEPSYTGDLTNVTIIPEYLEKVDLNKINANTIIMSDVFEHFYNPLEILNKIKNSSVEYIYLNHPDFDYSIKNNIFINLNSEHTFLIEHQFLFKLFENNGFILNRRVDFENFSLFLEFKRVNEDKIGNHILYNYDTKKNVKKYVEDVTHIVKNMNEYLDNNPDKKFYIWPWSIHSIPLFTFGLNYKKLAGVLDNSPNKIGKYIYGYDLLCSSFNELLKTEEDNIYVFISGAGNYIKELDLTKTRINIIPMNYMLKLIDLIDNTKTDKNTSHSYLETYERVFNAKKYNYNNILEIGIGEPKQNKENGGSIKLWYDYFPNSNIYGLDIISETEVNDEIKNKERVHLLTGIDAYNNEFIESEFIKKKNIKFDILIDDGPHTKESMIQFIVAYLPLLNKNGILIIEDIPDIDWAHSFVGLVPEYLQKNIEIVDLRNIKGRWDDIMFIVKNIE